MRAIASTQPLLRRRAVAASVLLLLLAGATLPAPVVAKRLDILPSSGLPAIYQGEDTVVVAGAFNHEYLGTREAGENILFACHNHTQDFQNIPICRGHRPTGYSKTYIHLAEVNPDPAARAGIGIHYDLKQMCVGQPLLPVNVTSTYRRWANVSGGIGFAHADVWGNAFEGRGTPGTVEIETGNHKKFDTFVSNGGGATPVTRAHPTYTPPAFKDYKALVYSFSHAGRIDNNAAVAHADVGMYLEEIRFNWTDDVKPWTHGRAFETATGATPVTGYPGAYIWHREPVRMKVHADDAHSCPRHVNTTVVWSDSGIAPPATLPVNFNKDPVRTPLFSTGRHHLEYYAEDHQGTRSDTTLVRFGVDLSPPTIDLSIPRIDGKNGWYASSQFVQVYASDAISHLHHANYQFTGQPSSTPVTQWGQVADLPQGHTNLTLNAWDWAGWQTTRVENFRSDWTPPAPKAYCTPLPSGTRHECGTLPAPWYNQALRVSLECEDAHSGCQNFTYSRDGGPTLDAFGVVLDLTADAITSLQLGAEDVAGLTASKSYTIRLDRTPPTRPDMQETHGVPLIRVNPSWVWGNSTDALSGNVTYSTWHQAGNGVHTNSSFSNATSFNETNARDGENCMSAVAKDAAHNVGERSAKACVLVDRTYPNLEVIHPRPGGVYVNDQHIASIVFSGNSPQVYALGPLTYQTRSTDPIPQGSSYASGIEFHYTTLNWNDWAPSQRATGHCPLDNQTCHQTRHVSPWRISPFSGNTLRGGFHSEVWRPATGDHAGNDIVPPVYNDIFPRPERSTIQLSLVVASSSSAARLPIMDVHWFPFDGPEAFIRYEIHRSVVADFTPSALTKHDEVTNVLTGSYQDTRDIQPLVTYHYQIVVVTDAYDPADPEKLATHEFPAQYDPTSPPGAKKVLLTDPSQATWQMN